jgi:signal transduction histidine kinase
MIILRNIAIFLVFLVLGTGPALAVEFLEILERPDLVTFTLLSGFFIALGIWAVLERLIIARRFKKVLEAKSIEDELLDFAPAGYLILRKGGFCYCSDRLREWLGLTSPINHFEQLQAHDSKPGFDAESFEKLRNYILQIAKRRIPLPLKLTHSMQDEELYVFGKNMKTADPDEAAILLWVTLGEVASQNIRGTAPSGRDGESFPTAEGFDLYLEAQSETLNGLSTSVAIFGPDQALRFCNQAFRTLWSLPDKWEEAVPNHSEFLDKMREERRLPEQADFASWKKHILGYYAKLRDPVEEMWHLPDGRTLRVITQPYLLGGLIVFFEDVTDRLDLERSYNTLIAVQKETLDHLHEAVTVIGSDGRIRLYNPNFVDTWKLDEAQLKNRPHISELLDMCKPLLSTNPDVWNEQKNQILGYIINRDQRTGKWELTNNRVLQFNIVPLPDGATLLTLSDVSDTFEIEHAMLEKNKAIESADKMKSGLISGISEDLRLPMASIQRFAEILDNEYFGPLNDKQKNYLSWILKASAQVREFMDDVIDLAEVEGGQAKLEADDFDLAKALKGIVDDIHNKGHRKHFTIAARFGTTTGKIVGDEARIKKAFTNILEDAVERIPAGGKISVASKGDSAGAEVTITYLNSEIPVFMRDQMPDDGTEAAPKADKDAMGLRLSLAGNIIKMHDGSIQINLRPDKDSKILCHIPRKFTANFPKTG